MRTWWDLGIYFGVPVRAHWSAPILFLLAARGIDAPLTGLALLALVLAHEAGHAWMARHFRLPVVGIDLHGLGGLTRYHVEHATRRQTGLVAWAGVGVQAPIALIAWGMYVLAGQPQHGVVAQLAAALVGWNVVLIGLNLVPMAPLDGARAWPLLWRTLKRLRGGRGPGPTYH